MCSLDRPRITFTLNPMTDDPLYLCSMHAKMHREGHTFPVQPFTEAK